MTTFTRSIVWAFFLFALVMLALPVFATRYDPPDITNITITEGMTNNELSEGIATAMAAGQHQFDYSTSDWQGSIAGAWQLGGDDANNVSFGIAKRFKEDIMPDVLLHITYTPDGSDDWVTVGGTFRF